MKEVFEKLKERLKEADKYHDRIINLGEALSIVSEVEAEYGKDINVLGNGCEKQTYEICLNGCDDDTTFKMDLTESEYQFLLRVSELANETSTYGCMPRLYVKEYTPTTD
jgi:hypothetical protein